MSAFFPSTSIGDNVTIASFSEIKNSVIEGDVYINSHALIQDSVIDSGCVIGAQFNALSQEADVKIDHEYHTVKTGGMVGRKLPHRQRGHRPSRHNYRQLLPD